MKCFQCDAQAVAVCDKCFVGQCEQHLAEDRADRARIGHLVRCTHRMPEASSGSRETRAGA
jgi:hypothetical protein